MRYQRTIRKAIACSGKGLHSGARVSLRLKPAPAGHGIVFVQKRSKGELVRIKVEQTKVVATDLSTTLGENGGSIQTVEHLLSALAGLRITNLLISLDSEELPIMDGSAGPFVRLIHQAGIVDQKEPQSFIKINNALEVRDG
ncbi:MAG TPA: UDP-3-O-acyl-N-acetylglucosamine deacetylase, partial [Nitrospiria bacterium]|nr:UDP-3-O-acyl-N-acetylglucosamine deacetylase [Nitrospiria bacterium]